MGTQFAFLLRLSFVAAGRDADGIVLEISVTRNRATSEQSHSKNIWSRWHELNILGRFVLEYSRARATLSVGYFPFLIVARKLNRLESQAGKPGKAEVSQVASGARSAGMSQKERPTFYRQEVNKTIWEVPVRYQNLSPVGSGAYGTVW